MKKILFTFAIFGFLSFDLSFAAQSGTISSEAGSGSLLGSGQTLVETETGDVLTEEDQISITKTNVIYNDGEGELFIYGTNFGKDSSLLEVLIYHIGEENEKKLNIKGVYGNLINIEVDEENVNGYIEVKKDSGKKDADGKRLYVYTKKYFVDFKLPEITKVEAPEGFGGGREVIIFGKNFVKPSYGLIGGEEYICEKETETSCSFTIPADEEEVEGEIGIRSFGFEDIVKGQEVNIAKKPEIEVIGYGETGISIKVKNYKFEDLREKPQTESEVDEPSPNVKAGVELFMDNTNIDNCTINRSLYLVCNIEQDISYKSVGYVDFFGSPSELFDYELDSPQPSYYKAETKWSSYVDRGSNEIKEGNLLHLEIGIKGLNYREKDDFSIFFGGTEYKHTDSNVNLESDKVTLKLEELPSEKTGEIYFKLGRILSKSITYNLAEFLPQVYKVSTTDEEDIYLIEGVNLTNFNDSETVVSFGESSLNSNVIQAKIDSEISRVGSEINRLESQQNGATNEELKEIDEEIRDLMGELEQLNNGVLDKSAKDDLLEEGEIIRKSNRQIRIRVMDTSEYDKSLEKGEYEVSVRSNGKVSNVVKFFLDPNEEKSESYAIPTVDDIDYTNGAGDPSKIRLIGTLFSIVTEVYFGESLVEIIKKSDTSIELKLDQNTPNEGPITMKLKDGKITNTLFVYKFFENKSNKISISWKKEEEEEEDSNEKKIYIKIDNFYKKAILEKLVLEIKNKSGSLPFYKLSLSGVGDAQGKIGNKSEKKIQGIIDRESIEFTNENISEDNEIDFYDTDEEDGSTEVELLLNMINEASGEFEIKIKEISFFDSKNLPNKIKTENIEATNDSYFFAIEGSSGEFCIKKIKEGDFRDCNEDNWIGADGTSIYEEEVIKSEFLAPERSGLLKLDFNDIPENEWYKDFVENLYQREIIKGYKDGSFKAGNQITRAEAVKMLLATRGEDYSSYVFSEFAFSDVSETHWAKNLLEYAVRKNYLTPVKNFYPNKEITRSEAVKLIITFFGRKVGNYQVSSFGDLQEHWSKKYVEYLYQNGIVSGVGDTGNFEPNKLVTRAEFSKMLSLSIELWSQ